jgi:hypothetical protein
MQLNSQTMGFCVCVGLAQHSIPVEVVGTLAEEGTPVEEEDNPVAVERSPVAEDTLEASAALQSRIVAPRADHN